MNRSRVPALLFDLVKHAERIRTLYAARDRDAFLVDQVAQDATLWNFVVLGEICTRLGDAYQSAHPSVPWQAVIAHRNIIAHGYDTIDWVRVRQVIEHHIPLLIREAGLLLEAYGPPPANT